MGSFFGKNQDNQDIQMFLTLTKPVIYAGQLLQGTVHINCLRYRPSCDLNIAIVGRENVRWIQDEDENYRQQLNQTKTYYAKLKLARLDYGIQRGHHSFPFSILLPAALPASMDIDSDNFIKYHLSVDMPAFNQHPSASFSRQLHIRQPMRIVRQMKKLQGDRKSFVCCCCCFDSCSYGPFKLSLDVSDYQIDSDKFFKVRGSINNLNKSININNYSIVLTQVTGKVSDKDYLEQSVEQIVLYDANKPVAVGAQEMFQVQLKLPSDFTGYTAIGNSIYRIYYLTLVAKTLFCLSNPRLNQSVVFIKSKFSARQHAQNTIKLPEDWSPETAEHVAFVNLPPYIYKPSSKIQVRNQCSNTSVGMMAQMQQMHVGDSEAFMA